MMGNAIKLVGLFALFFFFLHCFEIRETICNKNVFNTFFKENTTKNHRSLSIPDLSLIASILRLRYLLMVVL
jgi:hypothetical protein